MKRIAITGINGVIGSELKKRFIEKGYYVVGIDRTELQDEDGEHFEYVIKSKNKFGLK